MTDNQRAYEAAICEVAHVDDIGDVSDGFHTFNQLYHQRAMLFAALVNQNRDISWKTRKHEDGEPCFGGGWFLVTIDTPAGPYGYHYEEKYWDMFHCKELERAKHWDGYTEEDVGRLMSLCEDRNCVTEPSCFNCKWHNDFIKWCNLLNIPIDGRANTCAMWECRKDKEESDA